MTPEEAINAIYRGDQVQTTEEEYRSGLRGAIQTQAGKWIDDGDTVRAQIALMEVERLDKLYGNLFGSNAP